MVFNALNIAKKTHKYWHFKSIRIAMGYNKNFPKNNKIAFYCSYCLYCFHCFLLFSLLLCIVAIVLFIVVHCKQYCVQYCLQYFQEKTSFPFKMATSYKKRAVRVTPVHVSEYARVACFGTQYSCFYF